MPKKKLSSDDALARSFKWIKEGSAGFDLCRKYSCSTATLN